MGASFYGELIVRITSDTKGLSKGLAESTAASKAHTASVAKAGTAARVNWERAGLAMQNVGRTMTQFVSLPTGVVFAAAAISAFKYEKSLQKLQTMVSMTAEEARTAGDQFLEMGDKFGRGAQELVEAYYFISSSGFKGAEAMGILEASAKAAAAGMGDVQSIADLVTSAMSAYGKEQYSATDALDIFLKTIEVGKAEPEHLAGTLGRIMSIAQQVNVPLEEVGGTIAAMTLTGKSTAEAVTALRGTLMALSAPAKMSIDALKKVDLTYKDVTRSLADKGLIPTLQMLFDKFDGNKLKMRQVIPNVRALAGVYDLLGENMEESIKVTKEVSDAQGQLEKSFSTAQESIVFKLEAAWARIKNAFIEIGQVILPYLADFAEWLADLFQKFQDLDEGTKKWILRLGLVALAFGPITMAAGSLIRSLAILHKAFTGLAAAKVAAGAAEAAGGAGALGAVTSTGTASSIAAVGTAAGTSAIAVAGLTAGFLALGGAIIYAAHKQYDPDFSNAKRNLKEFGEWIGWEWAPEVKPEVEVKYIAGSTEKIKQKVANMRLEGEIVLTADDVDAYVKIHSLQAYVTDPSLWTIPVSAHVPKLEQIEQFYDEFGINPQHDQTVSIKAALKFERQQILNALTVTNIFEKPPPPIKVPFALEGLSGVEKRAFFESLTPKQALQVKWELVNEQLAGKKYIPLPPLENDGILPDPKWVGLRAKASIGLQEWIDGMEAKRPDVVTKAEEIAKDSKSPIMATVPLYYTAGYNSAQGYANGLGNDASYGEALAAADRLAALADWLDRQLQNESPSRRTRQSGIWFVEGFAQGIDQTTSVALDSVTNMTKEALALTDPAIDMGLSIAEGIAVGIERGSDRAIRAAKTMGRGVLGAQAESLGLSYSPQSPESLSLGPVYRPGGGISRITPAPLPASGTAEPAPPQIIEENLNVNLPAGTTLVGSAQTVANMLAPHLAHQVKAKELERLRRR